MTPLEKRRACTMATMQRFARRKFRWGNYDCAKIAAFHARQFGWKVPKVGAYASAVGAARRLRELGCETLPQLIDATGLPEIAPARAMMGDLVSAETAEPLGGVGIVVGNGNMLVFHEDVELPVIMSMGKIDRAWSILKVPGQKVTI